jgi:hypothetical protein
MFVFGAPVLKQTKIIICLYTLLSTSFFIIVFVSRVSINTTYIWIVFTKMFPIYIRFSNCK